jgi:S1-C subfamily serine protease
MDGREPKPGRAILFHRFHTRLVLAALAAAAVAALVAGLAFAQTRSAPIGTGVVVVDTNLAYAHGQAAGTGMVLTPSGEVLTNNHVIRGATTIKVILPGTRRSYTAKVVGYSVSADVAVLQLSGASNLKAVSLADSAKVKVGQSVTAVGNAGGAGSLTRASGKVTALARAITVSDDVGGSERLTGMIETNADLQAGDSGGPLLSAAGKVIGMNTAASTGSGFQQVSAGDGFAIPINKAVTIVKRIENGKASATVHIGGTAFLGVQVGANGYSSSGAMIEAVVTGSAAARAGLVPGDLITSFAGHSVTSPARLTTLVTREKPRAQVSIVYIDQYGASHTTTVTLASGPPQ